MNWSDFSGKKIGLAGAGRENLSLVPHFLKAGAEVVLAEQWESEIPAQIRRKISVVTGENHLNELSICDYVYRAPGLPLERLKVAIGSKPIISSATELIISDKSSQIIGVTGTKGKGTTSTMIGCILEAMGKKVIVAGNIGRPIFDLYDSITQDTSIVMELSSFQLEDISHSPHVAVVLPISPDHLQPLSERSPNYHKDLQTYIMAKGQITAHQTPDDVVVFSQDSQASAQLGQSSAAKKISVSTRQNADVTVREGVVCVGEEELDLHNRTTLRGDHLFHNAAVACAVAKEMGATISDMANGLNNFRPLPHRMEPVGTFGGIEFIDDSYATAPDATIAALSAFRDKSVVLILGGSSKGADFTGLAEVLADSSVKAAVIIGQEGGKIESVLKERAAAIKRITGFSTFRDAVETAVHQATSGDVVLLSPACASKDMFENAADRGDQFKKIIHELF